MARNNNKTNKTEIYLYMYLKSSLLCTNLRTLVSATVAKSTLCLLINNDQFACVFKFTWEHTRRSLYSVASLIMNNGSQAWPVTPPNPSLSCFLLIVWSLTSLQHLRSNQAGYQLVVLHSHGDFIVLPHWKSRPPAS